MTDEVILEIKADYIEAADEWMAYVSEACTGSTSDRGASNFHELIEECLSWAGLPTNIPVQPTIEDYKRYFLDTITDSVVVYLYVGRTEETYSKE